METISEFPDKVLLKILSLLPSKNMVATSVLSKRWRSLWKEVNTFRYEGDSISIAYWRFSRLISRRSNVESLQLKMTPTLTNNYIKPLVNIAVARSLRELKIEMGYNSFELPQGLYIFSTLETLILEKLSLVDVPSRVRLRNLKRLHLLSVKFSRDESVRKLLSICPLLEDLVVRRSSYTNVKIFTINNVSALRSLSIDNSSGKSRPKGVHGFVINAPSLKCFSIRDSFSNYLRFENMPELVKASLNVVVCDQPDKFLGSLASTRYLSLCCVTSKLQTRYPPTATCFLFLEHLELCLCSAEWWNLLIHILNEAPRVRVLKLKSCTVQHKDDKMNPWKLPDSVPECLSSHLEIFEWRQHKGTKKEREVAKYILANASCLKKVTFYSESAEKHQMLKD